jgi:hypothetical protein
MDAGIIDENGDLTTQYQPPSDPEEPERLSRMFF